MGNIYASHFLCALDSGGWTAFKQAAVTDRRSGRQQSRAGRVEEISNVEVPGRLVTLSYNIDTWVLDHLVNCIREST